MGLRSVVLSCVLGAAACASSGDALVVITVESPTALAGVNSLHVVATAAGHAGTFDVKPTTVPFTIPPSHTFAVQVPSAFAGTFSVVVDALDAAAITLATGMGSTTSSAGKTTRLTVTLGGATVDLGGLDQSVVGDGGGDGGPACMPALCAAAGYGCGMLNTCDCGPCLLAAVTPSIANTNDTLTLEGSFGPDTVVTFPGGTTVAATLLGPNRATVKVPSTATAGVLSISVGGGQVVTKAYFRRASFPIGLQTFSQTYEQADAARLGPVLAVPRNGHALVHVGHTVLAISGTADNGGAIEPSTESATVNADGTIGSFTRLDAAHQLATPRTSASVVQSGQYLYIFGGWDTNTNVYKSVEHCKIDVDNIGPFSVDTFTLKIGRFLAASAIIGPYVYVFGGGTQGPLASVKGTKSIERAPILSDGSLGPFEMVAGSALTTARVGAQALVIGDHVYLFGGADAATVAFQKTVEVAAINPDGTLGAFADAGIAMSVDRLPAGAMTLGGRVYLFAGPSTTNGTTDGSPVNTIDSAPISANGTVGAFAPYANSLVLGRFAPPVLVGNYVTFVGGGGSNKLAERASINAGTTLGPFADNGHPLLATRPGAASAVIGQYLYLFGGSAGIPLPTITRAQVAEDGTIGGFSQMGQPDLSTGRNGAAVAILGNNLYVVGGKVSGGGAPDNTIDRFTFSIDGMGNAILTAAPSPAPFMTANRAGFQLVALPDPNSASGVLYAIGGPTAAASTAEKATIDAAGTLGAWAAGPTGLDAISERSGMLVGNTCYLLGGFNPATGNSPSSETLTATATGSSLGNFTAPLTKLLTQGRHDGGLFVLGGVVAMIGGVVDMNMDAGVGPIDGSIDLATISPSRQLMSFNTTAQTLVIARRGFASAVLGNYAYAISGTNAAFVDTGSVEQAELQ